MSVPLFSASSAIGELPGDLQALFLVICMGVAHLGVSSVLSLNQLGAAYILSARDKERAPERKAGRVARAYRNWLESFPQYAAALFLVYAAGRSGTLSAIGSWTFFLARLAYTPAYVFAPPGVRPICWMAGQIGVLLILAELFIDGGLK